MVAGFSVYLDTGGTDGTPGTSTDIDALGPPTLRFKQADNPTIDSVNPNANSYISGNKLFQMEANLPEV